MQNSHIVDCDGHLVEPPDLWESYLDGGLRAKAPRLVIANGDIRIAMEGRLYPQPEGNGKGFPGLPTAWYRPDDAGRLHAQELISPQSRLAAMDQEGIDIAVPFPTLGLYTIDARNPDLNAAICRAYNNWLYEEYLAADRRRLIGVGMVTLLDVGAAVDELRHAVTTLGFKGIYLRPNPVGGRALHDPAHDRFWAEAERLGVPVMFHEGTDGQLPTAGLDRFDNFFMTHMISHPFEQMLAALSMIAGGVVERFPRLKIAFLESGCGWLPFWLHRTHEHW
jgi:predicted TIM-barrel fold metal-dependent hydrolase